MEHEGANFQVSHEHDTLQGAFVHRTRRGQAAGGVRYWQYETMEDYLRDGLRLAKGMTRKNALAGTLSVEEHPLTGHRGRQIIDSLAANRWFEEDN